MPIPPEPLEPLEPLVHPDLPAPSFIDWAVASRPMAGEVLSGDVATVQTSDDRAVIAVIDGLGHGAEAAAAAQVAAAVVEKHRAEPLEALLLLAHEQLTDSRGVAATLAIVDGATGRLEWLGVGNVNATLLRADPAARPRSHGVFLCRGVLGYLLPNLHVTEPLALEPGDLMVVATDGVRGHITAPARPDVPVARLAETILADQATADDDALVLVARYRGPGGTTASHR
jgi:serine phosphatase RsbU (regulator of sigma subunit)